MGRPSKAEQQARNAAGGTDSARIKTTLHRRTTQPASDAQHIRAPAPPPLAPAPPIGAGGDPVFDPLLTIDQLAHTLGKPKGTLYQWRSRSMGPRGIKIGNDLRCPRSEAPPSRRLVEVAERRGRATRASERQTSRGERSHTVGPHLFRCGINDA